MENPDEIYTLDECTTIDKKITKRAQMLSERFIKKQNVDNTQYELFNRN